MAGADVGIGANVAVGADDDDSTGMNVAVGAEDVDVGGATVLWDRGVDGAGDGVPAGLMQDVSEASATIRHDSRTRSETADRRVRRCGVPLADIRAP